MDAAELKQKTRDELGQLLLELKREQFNLRMQKGTGQLSKPSEIRRVDRKSTRLNSSHMSESRMPSSA